MKYPYMVKHNGKYYPAGTEVPVGDAPVSENIPVADDKKAETAEPKKSAEKKLTRAEIMTLKKAELIELAKKNGIKNADEMIGSELKSALIKALKL